MDACRRALQIAPRLAGCAIALHAAVANAQGPTGVVRLPTWVTGQTDDSIQPSSFATAPRPVTASGSSPRELVLEAADTLPIGSAPEHVDEVSMRRRLRQLEHAASEARTNHALTRLLRRCEGVRLAAVEASDAPTAQRADRIASWALETRAQRRSLEGRYEPAIEDYQLALVLNSDNLAARHGLGLALANTSRLDEALVELSRVIAQNPGAHQALVDRARTHFQLGAMDSAVFDCDSALECLGPDEPIRRAASLQLRGVALHAAGRLREAATDLNEAIRLRPDDSATLVARGHVFAEGGFYDQAVADYAEAVHADPASAAAYRALAWALATCPEARLRDASTAVEASWRARRLAGVDDFLTLEASAAAHAAAGDFSQAIRLQQRALMAPDAAGNEQARERLAEYTAGRPYVAVAPKAAIR